MRPGSIVRLRAVEPVLRSLWHEGDRTLDVGGYDGSVSTGVATSGVVVLDLDDGGLRTARRRGASTILGSAAAIPLGEASVDLALSCDLLPSVGESDAGRVYPEVGRVLRPGGHLVVTEVDERFKLPFVDNRVAFEQWQARLGGASYERLAGLLGAGGLHVVEHRMFYGLPTRLAYTVFYFWKWPRRGARVKRRLFQAIAASERWWCPLPQAHLVVARMGA
jgi:ubiquinone/menaquinone biosynthesis C-methylase UbiE